MILCMTSNPTPALEPEVLPVFRLFAGLMFVLLSLSVVPQWGRAEADAFARMLWLTMGILLLYLSIRQLRLMLGRFYLPLALALASGGPILADALDTQPAADPARLYFWLILPLLLVSAQYGMRSLLAFTGTIGLLPPLLALLRGAEPALIQLHGTHALGRLIIFLVAGYIVLQISRGQRSQRHALALRNAELAQLAATREQLATSRERNRLARELHDTLAHTLSAVNVQLKALEVLIDQRPTEAKILVQQVQEQTRSGLTEARRALASLRAQPVEELGLVAALERLASQSASRNGFALELHLPEQALELAPQLEQQIYQIAAEAINNVVRHARASKLCLAIGASPDELCLKISDNGIGFRPDTTSPGAHYGLAGMHERTLLITGRLEVQSVVGQGTMVTLSVPARKEGL
jgi:signal transduction histidine kinase